MSEHTKFQVWWVPQMPMEAFKVAVPSLEEGWRLTSTLADYDAFQFVNNIKPDYCNTGGVSFSHPGIEGGRWYDAPDAGDEFEIEAWRQEIAEADALMLSRAEVE